MKGILILIGILSITISGQKLITTKDAIINRMISNRASNQEKASVFSQLKTLITSSPTTVFKINLDGLIETGNIYTYPAVIGGKVGEEAIETLRNTYNISAKPEKVLEFLRISLDFMRNGMAPDHVQWLFFHDASKILLSLDMDYIRKMLVARVWKVPNELLNALGIVEESTTTTTTTTTEVYRKPVGEYDLDLSADAIANLTQYWSKNPVLNDGILIKMLENSRNMQIINETQTILSTFQNSRNLSSNPTSLIHYFREHFNFHTKFDQNLEMLMKFRDFDFELVTKTLIKFQSDHKTQKEEFIRLLNESKALQDFFKRVQENHLYDAPLHLDKLEKQLLPEFKNFSVKQIEVLVDSIKKWKTFDNKIKATAEKLMLDNITEGECLDIWSKGMVDREIYDLVQMIDSMDNEFGLKSCFYMNRIVSADAIAKLTRYWKENPVLNDGILIKILEYSRHMEIIDEAKRLMSIIRDSRYLSLEQTEVFNNFEERLHFDPDFDQNFELMMKFRDFDFEIITKTLIKFQSYSKTTKEEFIRLLNETESLQDFFKRVQENRLYDAPLYLENLEKQLLAEIKMFSVKQVEVLVDFIKKWKTFDNETKETAEKLMSYDITEKDCLKIRSKGNFDRKIQDLVEMMDSMNNELGLRSCFSANKVGIPDVSQLDVYWKQDPFLRDGIFYDALKYVGREGSSLVSNSQTILEFFAKPTIPQKHYHYPEYVFSFLTDNHPGYKIISKIREMKQWKSFSTC